MYNNLCPADNVAVTKDNEYKLIKVTASTDSAGNPLVGKGGNLYKHSFFILVGKMYELTLEVKNQILRNKPYSTHPEGYEMSTKAVINGESGRVVDEAVKRLLVLDGWQNAYNSDRQKSDAGDPYITSKLENDMLAIKMAECHLNDYLAEEGASSLSSLIYKKAGFAVKAGYGDIVIADFSSARGAEINKRRPAVIVSNDAFNITSDMRMLCPITRTERQYSVKLPEGLKVSGYVLTQQMKSCDLSARDAEIIGHLDAETLGEIKTSLGGFI